MERTVYSCQSEQSGGQMRDGQCFVCVCPETKASDLMSDSLFLKKLRLEAVVVFLTVCLNNGYKSFYFIYCLS